MKRVCRRDDCKRIARTDSPWCVACFRALCYRALGRAA